MTEILHPGNAVPGSLLFTHRGISGPVALDISGTVATALAQHGPVPIAIDMFPGKSHDAWQKDFAQWRTGHGARTIQSLLGTALPAALACVILDLAEIPADTRGARLAREQVYRLIKLLGNLPLTVSGTEGFGKAMATRGGVALDEVDSKTMESKLVRGLFLAGEVLDVDGPCGGFNLQWAFASGSLGGCRPAIGSNIET